MDFLHGICHEISDELLQLVIGLKSGTWEGGGKCEFFFQLEKLSFACTKIKEFSHENEDYEVRNSNAASFYAANTAALGSTTATHLTTPQKFHEIRFLMCVAHL